MRTHQFEHLEFLLNTFGFSLLAKPEVTFAIRLSWMMLAHRICAIFIPRFFAPRYFQLVVLFAIFFVNMVPASKSVTLHYCQLIISMRNAIDRSRSVLFIGQRRCRKTKTAKANRTNEISKKRLSNNWCSLIASIIISMNCDTFVMLTSFLLYTHRSFHLESSLALMFRSCNK